MVAFFSLAAIASQAHAQRWAVAGGVTYSKLVDELRPWLPGESTGETRTRRDAAIGVVYDQPLRNWLGLGSELWFVTKGSQARRDQYDGVTLRYAELPVLLRLGRLRSGTGNLAATASFGIVPALMLACRWTPAGETSRACGRSRDGIPGDAFNATRLDIGVAVGAGVETSLDGRRMRLEARYNQGLSDLDREFPRLFRSNSSGSVGLAVFSRS